MRIHATALTGATFGVRECQAIVHLGQSFWLGYLSKQTLAFRTFPIGTPFSYLLFMPSYKYACAISSQKEHKLLFFTFLLFQNVQSNICHSFHKHVVSV